jgi:hypothetical protein
MKKIKMSPYAGMGSEPTWKEGFDACRLIDALYWYGYGHTNKDSKEFVMEYCKASNRLNESEMRVVKSIPENQFPLQIGWFCRMLTVGMQPDVDTERHIVEQFEAITNYRAPETTAPSAPIIPNTVSVQDRIVEKAYDEAGDIEGLVDSYIASGFKKKIDVESYVVARAMSSVVLHKVCAVFVQIAAEIEEVLSGKDDQLSEGYSNFTKAHLRRLHEFYGLIIAATNKAAVESKSPRKKRKTKEKPASVIVAKVQWLEEYPDLNLKSISPVKVVGAVSVWVYNTKTKLLGEYKALDTRGFTFKGTTLQNFDEKTAIGKRLRKPEIVIPEVMLGGKIRMKKLLPDLKTKEVALTGRFNGDVIILKIT